MPELLAQRHTDRRRNLRHNLDGRIVNSLPYSVDVGVYGDRAGGADARTLPALHAVHVGQVLAERRADHGFRASVREIEHPYLLHLAAYPHTVSAEYALIGVANQRRRGTVERQTQILLAKPNIRDPEPSRKLLEPACAVLAARGALAVMVGQQKLENCAPYGAQLLCVRAHHHPRPGFYRARRDYSHSVYLDNTHPARPINRKFRMVAEGGQIYACLAH